MIRPGIAQYVSEGYMVCIPPMLYPVVALEARRPYPGRTSVLNSGSEKETWDQVPEPLLSRVKAQVPISVLYGSPPKERMVDVLGFHHSAPSRTAPCGLPKLLIVTVEVVQEVDISIERVTLTIQKG